MYLIVWWSSDHMLRPYYLVPRSQFFFWMVGLVYTVCVCAELRATHGEKGVCDLRFCSRVESSIAIFSSESIRRGSKDVLEAVFAVKVEAGDGMQQPHPYTYCLLCTVCSACMWSQCSCLGGPIKSFIKVKQLSPSL